MIELNQVLYLYDKQRMIFNFSVQQGEVVTILGPSGAGKSTLLSLIAGFLPPLSGQIRLNGEDETDTNPAKRPVSMLFQDNNVFTHLSVQQNLALGLAPSLKLTAAQHEQLSIIAERIGLTSYLSAYPSQLSGGQKQRVAIGRCLLQHRPILLLDEPFSSLDPKLKKEMFELLYEIQAEYRLTILMVTHQLEDIAATNNRCLVIVEGEIAFDGHYQQLLEQKNISTYLGI
ncbi:thiamine transport system ATP-binding protein [Orbus hercynius]|uniref:Thiamine transport system ATP-binding protein n=1 Tax=Orbus hercynius TaxID=593135 RepID=A0A495RIU2_9GAMM|nr:thiamine ABC transporter ATP-binding protein ThiQ [Orbus hercynius]RKS87453.1 thiamine transport system ATP-binding protein [Orbus hercynius]